MPRYIFVPSSDLPREIREAKAENIQDARRQALTMGISCNIYMENNNCWTLIGTIRNSPGLLYSVWREVYKNGRQSAPKSVTSNGRLLGGS